MASHTSCLDLSFNELNHRGPSNLSLVGKLITQKTINNAAIISVLQSTWNLGQNVHIKSIDKNMVVCVFRKTADRDRIEDAGPWAVKGDLLNLQRWPSYLTLDEVSFSRCNFWLQIHNLPPNRRNQDNIRRIANHVGNFLQFDASSTFEHLHKFVRVQVRINVQGTLCPGSYITKENGEKLWLSFKYERLSDFCYGCGGLDHTEAACMEEKKVRYADHGETQLYGPWMRSAFKMNPKNLDNARPEPETQNSPEKSLEDPHPKP